MALSYTPETESPEPDDAPGRAAFLFSLRSMFAPPAFLAESAWLEHIPFAFWTVAALRPQTVVELGVYNGPSYFAFCQAVAELGLDARCYGVDTWKGDAHAGLYGEEIHQRAQAYNDAHYSSFSRLVRSTFDEAAPHFSDGSIDLLHIDGLHAYEAVRHDFETWLPKLSDRAVVLLHDVNVRERGFGVFKFFEEIRRERPTFEFSHGHGLGVVGVGALQSEWMTRLYEIDRDADAGRAVRETFARLGRGCAEAFEARRWEEAAHKLRRALDESGAQLREASAAREAARGEIEAARAEGRRLGAALEASAREAAAARTTQAALAERAEATEAAFQKVRAALSETEREAIAAKAAAEALETRVLARLASLDELRARLREAEARRDAMADAAAEAGAQSETRVEEIVTLTKLLGEAETKAAATRRELDAKKPVEAECGTP
ncbi:class I SAM-dependent methyltransferase [Methylocella sp.]|uniref:class I SAM-dependent methyltransferase n=1 Tax=Methylocella sp. TaxID=1978226 RepID=UPI0037850EDB